MKKFLIGISLLAMLSACEVPVDSTASPGDAASPSDASNIPTQFRGGPSAARAFAQVTATLEPVAERECRNRTSKVNCDFRIVIDDRRGQPPNAYQTLDKSGRPVIAFTTGLINEAQNIHELAFVMGHEAAHHIQGHIARQRSNALAGAVILAGLATASGADAAGVREAQRLGAIVGARSYSKEFELEADALGTVITARAGYQPLVGAQFFNRIPDPGNKFLGTHPPNAARLEVVRRTAAGL